MLAQTANGSYFAVILSVVLAAAVTFVLTAIILRASRKRDLEAMAVMTERQIKNIVFACDAGMGSSAMGARHQSPDAIHVSVDNFMNSPRYDEVVELIRDQHQDGA